jgi:hypothetical protein
VISPFDTRRSEPESPSLDAALTAFLRRRLYLPKSEAVVLHQDKPSDTLGYPRTTATGRNYVLVGRPDFAYLKGGTGKVIIGIDFKTTDSIDRYRDQSHKAVAAAYAWLLSKEHPEAEEVWLVYVGLRPSNGRPYTGTGHRFKIEDFEGHMKTIDALADLFLRYSAENSFPANTRAWCKDCLVLNDCPEGQRYLNLSQPVA